MGNVILIFVHERWPWHPKLSCNSYKNYIFYQYIVYNNPVKINDLAQRVHVSEILHHFPNLPTHLRSVYDPSGPILAIL